MVERVHAPTARSRRDLTHTEKATRVPLSHHKRSSSKMAVGASTAYRCSHKSGYAQRECALHTTSLRQDVDTCGGRGSAEARESVQPEDTDVRRYAHGLTSDCAVPSARTHAGRTFLRRQIQGPENCNLAATHDASNTRMLVNRFCAVQG